ncbi:MAG TPA: hypothetical protein DHV48_10555 [Prolixibacteraceae bacterium]|nr:hypothetical protein [Prolixibacteraceae bacterium]
MRIIYLSEVSNPAVKPTVVLNSVADVTFSGFNFLANVTNDGGSTVTVRGIEANTKADFTGFYMQNSFGSGAGEFSGRYSYANENGQPMSPNTTYYARAYAINSVGISYSNVISFTTPAVATIPSIILNSVSNITHNGATVVSNVSSDGGSAITARGCNFYLNADCSGTPVIVSQPPQFGMYSSAVQTLQPETNYYARAWAQNALGTANSNVIGFSTPSAVVLPSVVLNTISGVGLNNATYEASVVSDGGSYVIRRGCSFYTNADFSGEHIAQVQSGGTGNFSGEIAQLLPGTTYYARAWAENSAGTGFSSTISFTTSTAGEVIIDIVEPEFIVLRYIWGTEDGKDLDTMTEFVASGVSGLDNRPVGYGRFAGSPTNILNILHWGGDNIESGQENVMIDIAALRASSGLIETSIVEFLGTWYRLKGPRHTCTIELKAYRGGTMSKVNYFEYQNNGGTLIYSSESTVKSVDSANTWIQPYTYTCDTYKTSYTKLGRLEYSYSTERARLIF